MRSAKPLRVLCRSTAKELKKADAEVNRVYHSTVKRLQADDAALLRKAQRAWLAYRDAQCEVERALWGGGTGGPAAWMSCKVELTRQRTAEIENTYKNQQTQGRVEKRKKRAPAWDRGPRRHVSIAGVVFTPALGVIHPSFPLRGRWERSVKSDQQAPSPSLVSLHISSFETRPRVL
jgi:uncharacterized protein YecT (DUF1311 family)